MLKIFHNNGIKTNLKSSTMMVLKRLLDDDNKKSS